MAKTLDLKIDREDSKPASISMPQYPTLHISSKEDHGLPDEGTALVHFKTTSRSNSEDEDGTTHYSCTIEVQNMSNIKASKGGGKEKEEGSDEEEAGESADEEAAETEETPPKKSKRSPAVTAALEGDGDY